MDALIQAMPAWLGVLGWAVVLVGYLLQRRAWVTQRSSVQTSIKGNQNQVSNTVTQSVLEQGGSGDSPLAMWGSWASIVGLALTLLPLIKAWLVPGA